VISVREGKVGVGTPPVVVIVFVITLVLQPVWQVEHGPCDVTVGVNAQQESAGGT